MTNKVTKLQINNTAPIFQFIQDGALVPISHVPINIIDKTEKLLYEDVADINQTVTVMIDDNKIISTNDYLSKSKIETMTKVEIKDWLKQHIINDALSEIEAEAKANLQKIVDNYGAVN